MVLAQKDRIQRPYWSIFLPKAAEAGGKLDRRPQHRRAPVAGTPARPGWGRRSGCRSAGPPSLNPAGDRERRTSRHGDQEHALHPLVVGVHPPAGDLARPVHLDVERKELRGGRRSVVVSFEQPPHRLVPLRAHGRSGGDVEGGELQPALDLEDRLRLQQRPLRRVVVVGEKRAAAAARRAGACQACQTFSSG